MARYLPYVGPPNQDIWEVGSQATDVVGNQWLCVARGVAGQPGTSFLQIGESGTPITSLSAANSSLTVTGGTTNTATVKVTPGYNVFNIVDYGDDCGPRAHGSIVSKGCDTL